MSKLENLEYKPHKGETIEAIAEAAIAMADKWKVSVGFKFEEVAMIVGAKDEIQQVAKDFRKTKINQVARDLKKRKPHP